MKPCAIISAAAESALGIGQAAYAVPAVGVKAETAIREDPTLARAGLRHPFGARVRMEVPEDEDPAAALLGRVLRALAADLDRAMPGWRSLRVGVVLGTSSGGMSKLCEALDVIAAGRPLSRRLAEQAPYYAPCHVVGASLGVEPVESMQILAACASSALAVGLGCRWVEHGLVDLCVAGGYDAVSLLVASGFEAIGATSASRPAPFRLERDGMALGEAAAVVALGRRDAAPAPLGFVRGFGASADAVHVTAPDREGRGLARAAVAALRDAGVQAEDVHLISAHATATPYNDAAEARAIRAVLGIGADTVVVHPFKAVIGHTLGASSVLEMLAALGACRAGILPAAAGRGALDPDARVKLLSQSEAGSPRTVLDLSAAFGGANAALVSDLDAGTGSGEELRGVEVLSLGPVIDGSDLGLIERHARVDIRRLSRMDPASDLAVTAAAAVIATLEAPLPPRTAVIVGTRSASVENDERFARRLRERGAGGVEPRRFPPTSPNLPPGQVGIAFGLVGPALAVGTGRLAALEALQVGHDLVRAGDAEAALVISVEHVGDAVRAIWKAAGEPVPAHAAAAVVLCATSGAGPPFQETRPSVAPFAGTGLDGPSLLIEAARRVGA